MCELIGCFVQSKAGRDAGKSYVIINSHCEYVYLVDGIIRTLDKPKKKNIKHINKLNYSSALITEAINKKQVINEDIKRAIKLSQTEISFMEVKPPL